jgi:peptide/nickel transport system substrate-binding protein
MNATPQTTLRARDWPLTRRLATWAAGMAWAGLASAQVLQIAADGSPAGLDPHVVPAFNTVLINKNIYEGLTAIDRDLKIVPSLATSWTISKDGLSYRFKLKPGVKFHNGKPMTAADVVASLARVRDTKTGSPYASRLSMVKEILADKGDVVINLNTPSLPLVGQLEALAIVPAESLVNAAGLQKVPMGTGPFKFDSWVTDAYVSLVKNPDYHVAGLPKLAGLKFNIVPESSTRQAGMASGAYQFFPSVDAVTINALARIPDVVTTKVPDLGYSLVGMNVSKPPFDNPKVREALNYALNRHEIVRGVYMGRASIAAPLPAVLSEWAVPYAEFPCYQSNPERAKALLQEAGVSMPLAITLNVLPNPVAKDTAEIVQAQLDKGGFKVTLLSQEIGKFVADWRASNFTAFVSLNGGGVDPDDYFYRTFYTGSSTNVFKYSNAALDKQLDAGRAATNKVARKKIYDEVQKTLACQGPIAFLANGDLFTAMRANVKDFQPLSTRSLVYLRQTTLEK